MFFSITLLYAALLTLVLLGLSTRVVLLRRRHHVGLGAGSHADLERAIRAQANFCEYVPITLVLLVLLEFSATLPGWVLHALGLGLVAGRIAHGIGLNQSSGESVGRFYGTGLTWLVMLICVALGLYLALARLLIA